MYYQKNILIVDDSPIVRQLVNDMLFEAGYKNIDLATNGREAIAAFSRKIYHLVLLDYNMPQMNGEEVLNHLREHYTDLIIIMLSDQTDKNVVVSLMRKADDYIIKDDIEKIRDELLHIFNHCFSYQDLVIKNRELMETLSQRNKKLEEEINMARKLQKEIFPREIEESDSFQIEVLTKPCATIGGDFFNIIRLDNEHIGIFLSDICGHGLQAALLTFTLANAFKSAINSTRTISARETVTHLNSLLVKQFPTGSFATCSYLVLNEKDSSITFSGAFETPLLYFKAGSDVTYLKNGNIVFLGLVDNEMIKIEESFINLNTDQKIFIFTDGLPEVKNQAGMRFGIEKIRDIIISCSDEPLKNICNILYDEARQYSEERIFDDITLIGIERKTAD